MTEYLRPSIESTTSNSKFKPLQRQEVVASYNAKSDTSLKALQMSRTGSAGAPALPESPLARGGPAVAGFSGKQDRSHHRPFTPMRLKVVQNGHLGSKYGGIASNGAFLDDDDGCESGSDLGDYSFHGNHESGTSAIASNLGERPRPTMISGGNRSAVHNVVEVRRPERKSLIATGGKREWTAIQTTTFTNWINDRLKTGKRDRKVDDLFVDLKDGLLLLKLLENLTEKKVKGFTPGDIPRTEAHKIVNLDVAFQFMRDEGIKLVGVGSMNIYQGNVTLTLGMIWTLIQKYQIRMQGYKVSTKHVMMCWLQSILPKWNITNLTSDWQDGRALIAIINVVKPGVSVKVDTLDPTKRRQNCILAIKAANSYLKIPKIISPDDLSSGSVDELSVMTYLSYFVEPFRAKLLKFVQKKLPRLNITGFTRDWYNGRAFGAMIQACFPDITTLEHLNARTDSEYIKELLKMVQKKLGISVPFTAADLASGKVEELQIMTMVLQIKSGDLVALSDEVLVDGAGIKSASLHQETSFTINATKAGPGQLYIDAYYEEDGRKLKFKLAPRPRSQVFNVTYTPSFTGKILFEITWADAKIPESPFMVPVTDSSVVSIVDFESHSTVIQVGRPLTLQLNTRKAGHGQLSSHLQYGNSRERIRVDINALDNGRKELRYTPPKFGTAVLHIFLDKVELSHLAITYTVVDVSGYRIEALPKNATYSVFEEPEFTVLAEKGLPLNVLQMTAILDIEDQIPINFTSIAGNRGTASFTPAIPGTYTVEVVCMDQLIPGTPFKVRVSDPHNCRVKGPIPTHLEFGKSHIFEISTKEDGVGSLTFESSDHDISSIFSTSKKRKGSMQQIEVVPLVEGDFVVGIKYQGQWISNCPFRLKVCDPSKLQVNENLCVAAMGKPVQFTVKAKEKCNTAFSFQIKANGPSATYTPQVKLSEDGLLYSAEFVPWEIGDHTIAITYGGFDIPNSPITLPVVSFDSDACSAAGSGLQKTYSNIPTHFLVLSKHNGLLEDNTLRIRVTSVIDNEECRIRARDNKNGTYSIAYLIQKPGAYLITILAAEQHIAGSPFKLNALPGPEADKCEMYGPALEESTVLTFGKPIDFTVDTSRAGVGKLSVNAIGPEGTKARVFMANADQPGKHDISIDALHHGKHRVSVKWSDNHIPCSPFIIKVFPGADSRKCIAHGPGLEDGFVGKKSSFTIDTKNAGAGILKVRLHGVKGAFKIEIAPIDQKNRRTLLAKYNPTQPGEYLITIKWSEMHVPGSPFRVKIKGDGTIDFIPVRSSCIPTPRLHEHDTPDFGDVGEEENGNDMPAISSAASSVRGLQPSDYHNRGKHIHTPTFNRAIKDEASVRGSGKMVTFATLKQKDGRVVGTGVVPAKAQ